MKGNCTVVWLSWLLCAGLARASFPHHVARALFSDIKHSSYSEKHVEYSDASEGRHIRLHYHEEQHQNVTIWNLDEIAGLSSAVNGKGSEESNRLVTMHLATSFVAFGLQQQVLRGDVMVNGLIKRFTTRDSELKAVTSLFKIQDIGSRDSNSLVLLVTDASLTDMFHSVNLNLSAALPTADHKPQPVPASPISAVPAHHQRRLQQTSSFNLGNALKSVQAKIQTLGNDVDALISTIQAASQFFENGRTYQNSVNETVNLYSFSVDNATHAGPQCQFAIDKLLDTSHIGGSMTGTCSTCWAYIGVAIKASINIQQGKLIDASVIMNGTANFQSTFDLTINATDFDLSKHISTLSAGPIQFLLGVVTIRVSSSTSIRLGLTGSVTGNVQLTGDMGVAIAIFLACILF